MTAKPDPLQTNLTAEAQRFEEDALYSSKGHYAAADHWRSMHFWIGIPTAILTGIAGAVVLAAPAEVFGISVALVFGLIAISGAVATAVMTFLTPERRANTHQQAGDKYNSLKGRARRFHKIDIHRPIATQELTRMVELLASEKDDLNQASPLIPATAYRKAKQGIQEGQASHETDQD